MLAKTYQFATKTKLKGCFLSQHLPANLCLKRTNLTFSASKEKDVSFGVWLKLSGYLTDSKLNFFCQLKLSADGSKILKNKKKPKQNVYCLLQQEVDIVGNKSERGKRSDVQ